MTKIDLRLGDCLEIMKDIPDGSIDCIITDPPYNMRYCSGRRKKRFNNIENDNNIDWLHVSIFESFRVMASDSHAYFFCNEYLIPDLIKECKLVGFNIKRLLVWEKNNHTIGDLLGNYANKCEYILFATKGRRLLNNGRDVNILKYKKVSKLEHPTQKPTDLIEFLILKSTKENNVILDCFMGSGSTGVACKNLNRNFIGIEKDPSYFEIAKNRIYNGELK